MQSFISVKHFPVYWELNQRNINCIEKIPMLRFTLQNHSSDDFIWCQPSSGSRHYDDISRHRIRSAISSRESEAPRSSFRQMPFCFFTTYSKNSLHNQLPRF